MTVLGPRVAKEAPKLVGRVPPDYAWELQEFLSDLQANADLLSVIVQELKVEVTGGGDVDVTLGDGGDDSFFHMGS